MEGQVGASRLVGDGSAARVVRRDDACRSRPELHEVAAVEGKLRDPLLLDDLSERRGFAFDLRATGRHFDLFRDVAECQMDVHAKGLVDEQ